MEDTIAFWCEGFAIGRNHVSATWAVRSKAAVRMEMRGIMCGGGLSAIVKMRSWTIEADG